MKEMGAALQVGPIPAGAGEPHARCTAARIWWAYPRRRGGTPLWMGLGTVGVGLSPQARGNLAGRVGQVLRQGPIPAGAGEPCQEGG